MPSEKRRDSEKISAAFARRLERTDPTRRVRAVLLLDLPSQTDSSARLSRRERREKVRKIQEAAEEAMKEVDLFLADADYDLLGDGPSALGSVYIEATPDALLHLAQCDVVRAVVEDQPILRLDPPSRPQAPGSRKK